MDANTAIAKLGSAFIAHLIGDAVKQTVEEKKESHTDGASPKKS